MYLNEAKNINNHNLLDVEKPTITRDFVDLTERRWKHFQNYLNSSRKNDNKANRHVNNLIDMNASKEADMSNATEVTKESEEIVWKGEVTLTRLNIRKVKTISYAPFFVKPGLYALRYVLVSSENSENSNIPHIEEQEIPRSFYFSNRIPSLTSSKILSFTYFLRESTKKASIYSFLSIPVFTIKDFCNFTYSI